METWKKTSLLLCVFGFLKEFRPSEPYITPYLEGPPMNFTDEQISQDIYPIATYSNMLSLIVIFLVTDIFRYKAVIIADGISGLGVYIILVFFHSLFAVQVAEVLYGIFCSGEVAYYTYIYAKVEVEHFQEVTSHTRSAYLTGRALSGVVSQIFVYFGWLSYYHLQFLTIAGLTCATLWAMMLPPVKQSIYFNQTHSDGGNSLEANCRTETKVTYGYAMKHLWTDFVTAFTNSYVIKWALWWALATCGYWQVLSYIQVLFQAIRKDINDSDPPLYGLVEAAYTLLGATASMSMGKVRLDWTRFGEPVLAVCSLAICLVLFIMTRAMSMALAYTMYICYTIVYHGMITVANSEVAKHVNRDSYGLIFGVTTFVALFLQTILTYVVNTVYQLSARKQFVVYSGYFGFLGICFLVFSFISCIFRPKRSF